MAQTIDYSLISNPELLDIVDEEWMRDTMPDDSIPLPEGVSPPSDDLDAADDAKENGKVEKWHELALVVPR